MTPANPAILYNVLVHGFSIGITYHHKEAMEWYFDSKAPATEKEFRLVHV